MELFSYDNDLKVKKSWNNIFKVAFCLLWNCLVMTTTLGTRKVGIIFLRSLLSWDCHGIDQASIAITATLTTQKIGLSLKSYNNDHNNKINW